MGRLLRLSATGTFQVFIGMASWIGLVRIISSFGSNAVAGYTIGIRVILFALLPSWGMANAAATMVGQALGARDPERAERAVWKAGFYNMIFLGVIGLLFIFFAPQIIGFYTADPMSPRTVSIVCESSLTVFCFMPMAWFSDSRSTARVTLGLRQSSISSSFGCGRFHLLTC